MARTIPIKYKSESDIDYYIRLQLASNRFRTVKYPIDLIIEKFNGTKKEI